MYIRAIAGGFLAIVTLITGCSKDDRRIVATTADRSRVYIISATGEPLYEPASFRTPAGGVMRNVDWSSYGGEIALGTGDWYGRRTTFQLTTISECRGYRAYLYVINTSGGGKPPPFPVSHCRDRESDIANPT